MARLWNGHFPRPEWEGVLIYAGQNVTRTAHILRSATRASLTLAQFVDFWNAQYVDRLSLDPSEPNSAYALVGRLRTAGFLKVIAARNGQWKLQATDLLCYVIVG